jgi:hypothetical protein
MFPQEHGVENCQRHILIRAVVACKKCHYVESRWYIFNNCMEARIWIDKITYMSVII